MIVFLDRIIGVWHNHLISNPQKLENPWIIGFDNTDCNRVDFIMYLEPQGQPFINGCFNWMISNLYIGNGCFTKHLFINGCLGFQVARCLWWTPIIIVLMLDSSQSLAAWWPPCGHLAKTHGVVVFRSGGSTLHTLLKHQFEAHFWGWKIPGWLHSSNFMVWIKKKLRWILVFEWQQNPSWQPKWRKKWVPFSLVWHLFP